MAFIQCLLSQEFFLTYSISYITILGKNYFIPRNSEIRQVVRKSRNWNLKRLSSESVLPLCLHNWHKTGSNSINYLKATSIILKAGDYPECPSPPSISPSISLSISSSVIPHVPCSLPFPSSLNHHRVFSKMPALKHSNIKGWSRGFQQWSRFHLGTTPPPTSPRPLLWRGKASKMVWELLSPFQRNYCLHFNPQRNFPFFSGYSGSFVLCLESHQLGVVGMVVLWDMELINKWYLSGRPKSSEALRPTPESYLAVKG